MDSKNLKKRVITGVIASAVFIALIIAACYSCIGISVLVLFGFIVVTLAASEYCNFSTVGGESRVVRAIVAGATLVLPSLVVLIGVLVKGCTVGATTAEPSHFIWGGIVLGLLCVLSMLAFSGRESLDASRRISETLFPAFLLVGVGGAFLLALSTQPFLLAWLVVVVALSDIGAFFTGSMLGGPKLSVALSPNKTISGSLGGTVLGVIGGVGLGSFMDKPLLDVVVVSVFVVFAGQLGDLAKSYLKRLHGVKDSGTLLPGHGGILDRIDGFLGAAPVAVVLWS